MVVSARPASLALCIGLCAALVMPETASGATVTDAAGRQVTVDDASRIVSLGGSITEILFALGLEDRVIAVDSTSTWPPRARAERPDVGYLRALSPEGVLSVGPTLILAEEDAGPAETVMMLEAASVPFVRVPDDPSPEGILAKVRIVAEAAGAEAAGRDLAGRLRADFAALERERAAIGAPARAMFVLSLADGRVMAAGDDTSAAAILTLAGAENALTGFPGYKPVSRETILAAAPEAIVMMAQEGHAATPDEVFRHPALAATPAAASKRLVVMDGLYLLGFGPRTADAARALARQLHPGPATEPSAR